MNISSPVAYGAASSAGSQMYQIADSTSPGAQAASLANLQSLGGGFAVRQNPPLVVAHLDLLQDYLKANVRNQAPYAQVVKDGQVVATVDNSGGVTSSSGTSVSFDLDGGPAQGPDLAQWRAEQIAKASGGQIVKADSAQTKATWRPPAMQSFQAYVTQRLEQDQASEGDGTARLDTTA